MAQKTARKMSQKTEQESGRRVRRMLQMMLLLQESQARSVVELADQFRVSRRTIFRDIQLLRDTGFPLVYDVAQDGYALQQRVVQHVELQPLELIAIAECGPGAAGLPFLRAAREVALAKLTASASSLTQAQVQYVREQLVNLLAQTDGDLDEATVEAMLEHWIEVSRPEPAAEAQSEPAPPPEPAAPPVD